MIKTNSRFLILLENFCCKMHYMNNNNAMLTENMHFIYKTV